MAGIPLLETKLYIPKWRPGLVSRPRLIECMHQGIERKLTLVSAPAGFGKTTLLAEWLAATPEIERSVGWVSLDRSDNDPAIFWAYVIAALRNFQPGLGATALSLLNSPQPQPIESVLTTLINEIKAIGDDPSTNSGCALVLDDFHMIDSQPVHGAVAFLLDHLPPQMHLILATRSDPPLPLARLRGRGESTELRASDLRFAPDEAASFLNEVMGLDLSAADVAALETRTEGWIAGLQLAALSMQGREDVPGFVAAFSGDDRYIVDYLVEEVLQRQPERVRSFLLQTSFIDRLSGPLCNAITGEEDGKGMLEALDRGNLFIVPLDAKRQWYRYHHLFADVLHAHSLEEQPDRVPALHRRASQWYEHNGLQSDAIRHALAGEDFERAAMLVELAWSAMHRKYQDATWLGWVQALPDELVRARPVLSIGYAWALLNAGEVEAGEARLRDAERWVEPTLDVSERAEAPAIEMVVADEKEFRSLPATVASARAWLAGARGDVPGTVKHARRALDLLSEEDHFDRGRPATLLGLAYWSRGDLEAAYESFADGVASIRMAGYNLLAISATWVLAFIRAEQGRLHESAKTYEQSLHLAESQGESVPLAASILHAGLSEIHREWGDLEAATQHLQRSEELREQAGPTYFEFRWRLAWARLKEARGDLDGAVDLLDEAESLYSRSPAPDVRPIAALRARVWIAQGRIGEALGWVREKGLSVEDDLSYLREFEHITLARMLIAQYRSGQEEQHFEEAMEFLSRLLAAAEEAERMGSIIEVVMLQALAHQAHGDIPDALMPLERALTLAEPEGYVRIFVDERESMRDLLRQVTAGGIAGAYTRRLLCAFDEPPASTTVQATSTGLVKPLTRREAEILRLIAAGLRNQEIADQLFISLATVKRHVSNIYGKLGVTHRTEAITRANELNLL